VTNNGLERRGAQAFTPDLWTQILWNKLRVEGEFAAIYGDIQNSPAGADVNSPTKIRMWGLATQAEFRAVDDKLKIQFGHGWSSGDPNVEGLAPGTKRPPAAPQRRRDLDVRISSVVHGRPHLLPEDHVARRGCVLLPAERRVRLHPEPERAEVRRQRRDHLEPRERVHPDPRKQARSRGSSSTYSFTTKRRTARSTTTRTSRAASTPRSNTAYSFPSAAWIT